MFHGYGKSKIKTFKCSPDAFAQLAIQLGKCDRAKAWHVITVNTVDNIDSVLQNVRLCSRHV